VAEPLAKSAITGAIQNDATRRLAFVPISTCRAETPGRGLSDAGFVISSLSERSDTLFNRDFHFGHLTTGNDEWPNRAPQ